MSKPERKPVEPLRTRHVFLDTEVYRRAGFNISNTPFTDLSRYIEEGRIVLHHTDITMGEIHRQLQEMVFESAGQAKRLSRDFQRLAQIIGQEQSIVGRVDSERLAEAARTGFLEKLISGLRSHPIVAQTVPALTIFERYFRMQPPFQARGSKEFPDAFVVEGLARYCRENSVTMYVVSADAAMREAAASYDVLMPLQTLDEILAAVVAGTEIDREALIDEVFMDPGFDYRLITAIENDLDTIDFKYHGPLTGASVVSARLDGIDSIDDYAIAAVDENSIGLILRVNTFIDATVQYVDETELRDKDDDSILAELQKSSRTYATLKVYVLIDLPTLRFRETELMTREVFVE